MNNFLVTRRTSSPQTIVQLWQAISFIRQQKQISNFKRVSAQMKKHGLSPADVEKELDRAVHDGLISIKTHVGCKGSKIGIEQDGYRIPKFEVKTDGHDWYCFTCHRGGEMALCSTCYRVFHEDCIEGEYDSTNFVCDICKLLKGKYQIQLGKEELNKLLSYTCMRLKEKACELYRIPHPSEDKNKKILFIFFPMDLCSIEQKIKSNAYDRLEEFYADTLQVAHNAVIYYGATTKHAAIASRILFECQYEFREIEQCHHCYRMSYQKDKELWFCQPCDPPHELVFAKQKGFPFWPAKVIKKENNRFDVRFFGTFHQRANIHEDYVRPITATLQSMGLKKTASLVRALNELKRHQSLVADFESGKTQTRKRTFEKASVTPVVEGEGENEEKKKKLPVTEKDNIPYGSAKDEEPKVRVGRTKHSVVNAEETPQTPEPKRQRLKQKSDEHVEEGVLNSNRDSEVKSKVKVVHVGKEEVVVLGKQIPKSRFVHVGKEILKSSSVVIVTKHAGDPSKVTASGPGLEPLGVMAGQPTYFDIFTKDAGFGPVETLEVIIRDSKSNRSTVPFKVRIIGDDIYRCEYVTQITGMHSVNVFISGQQIPQSPFRVRVTPGSD